MKKGTSVLDANMAAITAKLSATAEFLKHQTEKDQHVRFCVMCLQFRL